MRALPLVIAALLTSSVAAADPAHEATAPGAPFSRPGALGGAVKATERLPISGLSAVETDALGIVFMSSNGRFVLRGELWDLWSGRKLDTMAAIRDAASKLDMSRLPLSAADLGAMTYGNGAKRVQIWVDPKCPYCHQLLGQIGPFTTDHTFEIYVVPLLGRDSQELTRRISCATDQGAALSALTGGKVAEMRALTAATGCSVEPIQKRMVTAQMLGITGVPVIVAPDGRVNRGLPPDLAAFLAGGAQ